MNNDTITTKEMFELLRSDIKNQSSELKAEITELKAQIADVRSELKTEITDVRSDIQSLGERLRNVETAVAGTAAVATYKKTLIDWLFRIAAAVGVGGAIKAFLS